MDHQQSWINRIYNLSPMQTEKSKPEGERMSETRSTELTRGLGFLGLNRKPRFQHYPFTLGLRFFGLHRRQMFDYFFLPMTLNIIIIHLFFHFQHFTSHNHLLRMLFGVFRGGRKATSFMKF